MSGARSSPTSSLLSSKQRGYGAAVPSSGLAGPSRPTQPIHTITHILSKSDSLNSLAVKYDTTIADIKRANKLWNSESLSLRTDVYIPVYNLTNGASTSHTPDVALIDCSAEVAMIDCSDILPSRPAGGDTCIANRDNVSQSDFFAKFDKSLSAIRKKVDNQSSNSLQYLDNDEDELYNSTQLRPPPQSYTDRNGKSKSKRSSTGSRSSSDDVKTTPEPIIRSKAKKRLEQHEKRQNEELFQL